MHVTKTDSAPESEVSATKKLHFNTCMSATYFNHKLQLLMVDWLTYMQLCCTLSVNDKL